MGANGEEVNSTDSTKTNWMTSEAEALSTIIGVGGGGFVIKSTTKQADGEDYIYRHKAKYVISDNAPSERHLEELVNGTFTSICYRKNQSVQKTWKVTSAGYVELCFEDPPTSEASALRTMEPVKVLYLSGNAMFDHYVYRNSNRCIISGQAPSEQHLKELSDGTFTAIFKRAGNKLVIDEWGVTDGRVIKRLTFQATPKEIDHERPVLYLPGEGHAHWGLHYCFWGKSNQAYTYGTLTPTLKHFQLLKNGELARITQNDGSLSTNVWYPSDVTDQLLGIKNTTEMIVDQTKTMYTYHPTDHLVYSFTKSDQPPSARQFEQLKTGVLSIINKSFGGKVVCSWLAKDVSTEMLFQSNSSLYSSLHYRFYKPDGSHTVGTTEPDLCHFAMLEKGQLDQISKMDGSLLIFKWISPPKCENTAKDTEKDTEKVSDLKSVLQKARAEFLDAEFNRIAKRLKKRVRKGKPFCKAKTSYVDTCIEMQKRFSSQGVELSYINIGSKGYCMLLKFD